MLPEIFRIKNLIGTTHQLEGCYVEMNIYIISIMRKPLENKTQICVQSQIIYQIYLNTYHQYQHDKQNIIYTSWALLVSSSMVGWSFFRLYQI